MKKAIILIIFLTGFMNAQPLEVGSPDGNVLCRFYLDSNEAVYEIFYKNKPVIEPSKMSFLLADGSEPGKHLRIDSAFTTSLYEEWEPVWGTDSLIISQYNELAIHATDMGCEYGLTLHFRAFNDGAAFRYTISGDGDVTIMDEHTEFNFPADHRCWWIPADFDSYEKTYTESALSEVDSVHTPLTIETVDNLYISIHEADLTDYSSMALINIDRYGFILASDLAPSVNGIRVKGTLPLATPWRTIQIAESPGALIESKLILNCNDPCALDDTDWITAMKYMGIFWSQHIGKTTLITGENHGATTENAKYHIDYAVKLGIPALLIEGWNVDWTKWGEPEPFSFTEAAPDFDLQEVARYANEKNVKLILHNESGGDIAAYERQMDSAYSLYHSLGIVAVKSGYSRAGGIIPETEWKHGQFMVEHYRRSVKKAAEYRLMLNVHEPIKPTGIERTYPNMMTREGVRGMEWNAWSSGNPPDHTTILPFTRMLAGPLDYTPGIVDVFYNEYRPNHRVYSTVANQLALYVILFSPLQMATDLPENYDGNPAYQFIKEVPCDWDATKVINGVIGDYITIARLKNNNWYLGSITDEEARSFDIDLSFLDTSTSYKAVIYADGKDAHWDTNPLPVAISEMRVTAGDTLAIDLVPGGGTAVIFYPLEDE